MKLKRTVGLYKIVKFNKRRVPNKNEGGRIFQKLIRRTPSFIRHSRVNILNLYTIKRNQTDVTFVKSVMILLNKKWN